MKEKVKKFLDILKVELVDLEDDISTIKEIYKKRQQNKEITNYVLLENTTVLQRELQGIQHVVETMEGISPETYSNLDELIADLRERFRAQLADCQVPDMIVDLLNRKLEKVKEYVQRA